MLTYIWFQNIVVTTKLLPIKQLLHPLPQPLVTAVELSGSVDVSASGQIVWLESDSE